MNFISHFRGAMDRFARDHRHTQNHVAIYFALFHHWNLTRFQVPMRITRDHIMTFAGMRTPRVFYRCINELHEWGYLQYKPSHDEYQGTLVYMLPFDRNKGSTKAQPQAQPADQPREQPGDQPQAQPPEQPGEQPLLNSIINDTNDINKLNDINEYEHTHKNPNQFNDRQQPDEKKNFTRGDSGRESVDRNQPEKAGNKIGGGAGPGGIPGTFEEVEAYFAKQNQSADQATRFFNYYSNLGWRLGNNGRPMEDWRFAAKNWIINIKRFDHEPDLKPGALHIPRDRDYQQSL